MEGNTLGIWVFLVEIVSAMVVIFVWMNSLGKDGEVVTRTGAVTFVW